MNESADKLIITPQFVSELIEKIREYDDGEIFEEFSDDDSEELESLDEYTEPDNGGPDPVEPDTEPPVLAQPLEFPWPLDITQQLVFTGDRSVAVNLTISHPEIIGASDYEIRVSQA